MASTPHSVLTAMKWCVLHITVFILQLAVNLQVIISQTVVQGITDCQVQVSEPWPVPHLFAPMDSTIEINCTTLDPTRLPFWQIEIESDEGSITLQFETQPEDLNADGVFKIETPGTPPTVGLLINNTAVNNRTRIICDRRGARATTTLFIFNHSAISLNALDVRVNFIRLEWSQESIVPISKQYFSLTVSNGSNSQVISPLNESYYNFTAPEDAPPCEVYNFSVSATYVGATYTGAGCSVPSPVLSRMLPSLPNISRLESSLHFVLKKLAIGFLLDITIESASYCAHYPTVNYTVEVNNTLDGEILPFVFAPSNETLIVSNGLTENAVYSFRIVVANAIGLVSTNYREFYTTDVQAVTATLLDGVNASTIVCEFVTGSNAMGCMVVLISGGKEATYNLIKSESVNYSNVTVTLEVPQSCIDRVEAFDIEADGSVGSVVIPGEVKNTFPRFCTPTHPSPSNPGPILWIWITIGIIVGLVLCVLIAVSMVAIKFCRSRVHRVSVMVSSNRDIFGQDSRKDLLNQPQELNIIDCQMGEKSVEPLNCNKERQSTNKGIENVSPTGSQNVEAVTDVKENCYSEIGSTIVPGKGATGARKDVAVSQGEMACTPVPRESLSNPVYGLGAEKTGLSAVEALYDQPLKVRARERIPGDGPKDCKTSYCEEPSSPVIVSTEGAQYATVNKLKGSALKRTSGDVPEDCKTSYDKEPSSPVVVNGPPTAKCEGAQCTTVNNDHIYFTLEPRHVVIPGLPSPLTKDISSPPQPTTKNTPPQVPIYQEITEVRTSRKVAPTGNEESIPNTPHSSSSSPLIQRPLSDAIADSDTQKPVG